MRRSKRIVPFSKKAIDELPIPASGRVEWWDESTPNLSLRITANGVKTFYWVGRSAGEWTRSMIGSWPNMNVNGARTEAARISGEAAIGKPAIARAKRHRGEWTLQQLYDWYMDTISKPHKRTWKWDERQWENRFKQWADRRVSTISRMDVQNLHLSVGNERGPYAGNKVLEMLGHMYRQGNQADPVAVPCEDPTKGIKRFPREERERFLDADELPKFIAAVEMLQRSEARDFMMLALWTGGRRANVLSMRWDEISLKTGVWTIPKEKSKNKKQMSIALSAPAIAILKRRKQNSTSEWVLPGVGPTGHYNDPKGAIRTIRKISGLHDLRIHDLRRTLGSWMAINSPLNTVGKQLGHSSPKATAIYARLANKTLKNAVNDATSAMAKTVKKKKNSG